MQQFQDEADSFAYILYELGNLEFSNWLIFTAVWLFSVLAGDLWKQIKTSPHPTPSKSEYLWVGTKERY